MVAVFTNRKGDIVKAEYKDQIKNYFNHSHFFYRFFWMNKRNLSMHYGFWDKNTKKLHDALINENRYAAKVLNINRDDKVLDAGCGVGGTAIWVAENFGAKVTGVSISEKQVRLAKKYAKNRRVTGLTDFVLSDYCETDLSDDSFDKIYGMESICYAEDKADFLKEAFRLLKKGGKIVVLDGFLTNNSLDKESQGYYEDFCKGWALSNLASVKSFGDDMKKIGYINIKYSDVTEKVLKSSDELYYSAKYMYPLVKLLNKLHLTPVTNVLAEKACLAQFHIFKNNIGVYGVFTAEKPK